MLNSHRALPVFAALVVTLAACAPVEPPRQLRAANDVDVVKTEVPPSPWFACYQNFHSQNDIMQDLEILGRKCGTANGQHALSPVRTGEQAESDAVDRYTFTAGGPGKCYRIFAVADATVRDLDLQILSPDGTTLAADVSHDAIPVVPPQQALCLAQKGIYTVEVSVYRGSGHYALQIWSN